MSETNTGLEEHFPVNVVIKKNEDKTPQDVRVMGCSRGVMKSIAIAAGSSNDPPMLAGKDPRRSSITVWAQCASGGTPTNVYLGSKEDVQNASSQNLASGPVIYSARPPGSAPVAPLVMHHIDEIYVALGAADVTNNVTVSVITERWDSHGTP